MTAIVSKYGELLFIIQGNSETVKLNTHDDCIAVDDPPSSNMFYQDKWVEMPAQPSPHFIFDYEIKQWIDPRLLDEIKAQKWAEIKSQRDAIEFGGFEFEGNIFDSDVTAQARISAAASLGASVDWTTQSNTVVTMTAAQLAELLKALAAHVSATHERGRIAREAVFQATSVQDVLKVEL